MSRGEYLFDMVREAAIYCDGVVMDLEKRKILEQKYQHQIMELVFDEFVLDPIENTENIYKFLGLEMPVKVSNWMGINTNDSASIATKWKDHMAPEIQEKIYNHELCRQLFDLKRDIWKKNNLTSNNKDDHDDTN